MIILVTGAFQMKPEERALLENAGHRVVFHPDEKKPVEHAEQYEAVVCNGLFLHNPIEQFTQLRLIQLTSAGMDRVPMEYIRSHGIQLYNAAGVYSIPMAEWTILRILELYKNAGRMHVNQTAHRWEKDRSWQELAGKTACIIGFGAYGQETAKRLKAFDVRVTVVNRTPKDCQWADRIFPLDQIDQCLADADIVILAIALTPQTQYMINQKRLAIMKPGVMLINAARGALIDETALIAALQSGKVGAAALDVFEREPLPQDSPLWQMENVLLSSHNSFVGNQTRERLLNLLRSNLIHKKGNK